MLNAILIHSLLLQNSPCSLLLNVKSSLDIYAIYYLHKPACSPAPDPGKTELSDLVIAAAAAKMVKLDPGVPEPTAEEFGAQYCRKVLGCCQRGQWDLASETLKVTAYHY